MEQQDVRGPTRAGQGGSDDPQAPQLVQPVLLQRQQQQSQAGGRH